jgi:hypothetical protein
LQVVLGSTGLPLVGRSVQLVASNATFSAAVNTCYDVTVNVPRFRWSVVQRPAGSSAEVTGTSLEFDRVGEYRVRFTACPGGCTVRVRGQSAHAKEQSKDMTLSAVDHIVLPPEIAPRLPPQQATDPTKFSTSDLDLKCNQGGGVMEPSWVTVNQFRSAADYERLEANVIDSHISTSDNPLNHDSQDFEVYVHPDPRDRRLLSSEPEFRDVYRLGIEWERNSIPERYRPTPGDRVSIFGYWIIDCGHEYWTEIHPPVGIVTDRARAVVIPADFRPEGYPNGLGSNLIVPGVVADVWFNRTAGGVTECHPTSLAQPGDVFGEGPCIHAPSPVNRVFHFNIYLPRDPQAIVRDAGLSAPPVPLYVDIQGSGGPAPTYVKHELDDGTTWLDVSVNLSSLSGTTYARKIVAAWAYPDAANWGVTGWQLRLNSLDVSDDGDGDVKGAFFKGRGDWRYWVSTNNAGQEWTKLFDGDENVDEGLYTFPTTKRSGQDLGPYLLLFPKQLIWVSTSGYEEDAYVDDDTGTVAVLHAQTTAAGTHVAESECYPDYLFAGTVEEGCAAYRLKYSLIRLAVGAPTLTPEARSLADAYVIRGESAPACTPIPHGCVVFPQAAIVQGAQVKVVARLPFPAEEEPEELFELKGSQKALRARIGEELKRHPKEVNRWVLDVRTEVQRLQRNKRLPGEAAEFLAAVKLIMPQTLYSRYLAPLQIRHP